MTRSPKLISALKIIETLHNYGFEAYIVGGLVRDYCISLDHSSAGAGGFFDAVDDLDIDIASNAEPSLVEELFEKSLPSGLKYGTVTILEGPFSFEHTTFRRDVNYPEGSRKPEVTFSKTLEEDVLRRDFTMNALALDRNLDIIDLVGGRKDIDQGIIRTVGEAGERFREDSLRKLRALRFVSKLGFNLAEDLKESLREDGSLTGVALERIRIEFTKILMGDYVYKALSYMRELGMFRHFVPEIVPTIGFEQHSKYHDFTVFEHIIRAVSNAPRDEDIRTAAFFHDIGKPNKFTLSEDGFGHFKGHDREGALMVRPVLERLKYPVKSVQCIVSLIENHHSLPRADWKGLRKFVSRLGLEQAKKQVELAIADNSSKKKEAANLDYLYELRQMLEALPHKGWPLKISDLAVDGDDLIRHLDLSSEERPYLGYILSDLLRLCLGEPERNTKPILLAHAEKICTRIREGASCATGI